MRAYYGSKLSENMVETPEGYLICKNVPIARTGTQTYLRSELGIYDEDPNGLVTVYRTEKEVFSPATMASFEGKPVTDDHPAVGVDAQNITAFDNGHAQNVRRGTGDESDLLIADLFITSPRLIDAIKGGRREVSCGYDCEYGEENGKLFQRSIRGNHVAVVSAGRAGHRVAIKDSACVQKERERGKTKMAKNHSLFAQLFSRAVKDMEPEEIADAVEELANADCNDEEPVAPVEEPKKDGEPGLAELAAAITSLTAKIDALCAAKAADETPAPEPTPAPVDEDPLEKLEDELVANAGKEINPADEEPAETIPADEMTDEDGPQAAANELPENPIPGADSTALLTAIRAIKPVIASLPQNQRKAASDKAVSAIRKAYGLDKKSNGNAYGDIMAVVRQNAKNKAKDSKPKMDNGELGKSIMESRNPHYKK